MKEHLFQAVEAQRTTLTAMADSIFDDPELGFQEFHAQKKLTDYLTQSGFQVETGVRPSSSWWALRWRPYRRWSPRC